MTTTPGFHAEATRSDGDEWLIHASGELDASTVPELERVLQPVLASQRSATLDLASVSFVDSSGLRVIVRAANVLEDDGANLRVANASGAVARVLEVTGLLERLRDGRAVDEDRPPGP